MFTKRTDIGEITIATKFRLIEVRTDTIIEEDGVEISRSFHRHVLAPDADLTNEDQRVKDIAAVEWTQEIKDAWAAREDTV